MTPDTPKRAWQIHTSRTGEVAIEFREDHYYLAVEPVEGTLWEARVTEAVHHAADHRSSHLLNRIKELEEEIEFARRMLAVAAEHGLLDLVG